ncbi:MAG: NifB/NifX family molybdenum-iron cluster-binding protein [Ignavibacteria bacterium]|nr:NifB/NifX family molybdenum-iron cluster-binding protein [Ignavibacteria bacterium]
MNIAIPTCGKNGLTEEVYGHFGSAPYFTIYNTDTKEISVIDNNNDHHTHGQCTPVDYISEHNVKAVLTCGMGRKAVSLLNDSGIKVYLAGGFTVAEAIKNFDSGNLKELSQDDACSGHGGGH